MRRLLLVVLGFALAGCGTSQPVYQAGTFASNPQGAALSARAPAAEGVPAYYAQEVVGDEHLREMLDSAD